MLKLVVQTSKSIKRGVAKGARGMWHNIEDLRQLRQNYGINGLEFLFDILLLLGRFVSISYWLRSLFLEGEGRPLARRNCIIDLLCFAELGLLVALLACPAASRSWRIAESVLAGYILFEMYLNLFNIVFIGKVPDINQPPASVERIMLLLVLNILELALAFGILYQDWLGFTAAQRFFNAVLVLGTVDHPDPSGNLVLLVSLQVFLDILLIALFVGRFVNQTRVRRSEQ